MAKTITAPSIRKRTSVLFLRPAAIDTAFISLPPLVFASAPSLRVEVAVPEQCVCQFLKPLKQQGFMLKIIIFAP
jgi:hypothetical protein